MQEQEEEVVVVEEEEEERYKAQGCMREMLHAPG